MASLRSELVGSALLSLSMLVLCGERLAAQEQTKADSPPTFKGRTFEEWKRLLTNDLDAETRIDAYRALSAFSNHHPEEYLKPSLEIIKTSVAKERDYKVLVVGYGLHHKMSPAERKAFLLGGLRAKDVHRKAAVKALSDFDRISTDEATEELADAVIDVVMDDEEPAVRGSAMLALTNLVHASEYEMDWSDANNVKAKRIRPEGEYGPVVKKSLPVMEKLLNDENYGVRQLATRRLGSFPPEIAVRELAEQLRTLVAAGTIAGADKFRRTAPPEDERMAKTILQDLKSYGPAAQQALPILKEILTDFPAVVPVLGTSIRATIKAIEETDE